jgi:hypothetical protein
MKLCLVLLLLSSAAVDTCTYLLDGCMQQAQLLPAGLLISHLGQFNGGWQTRHDTGQLGLCED